MLINNENDMFLHTHLFNNTTKVNRAKRGALRLILGGARPMQVRNLERGPLTAVICFNVMNYFLYLALVKHSHVYFLKKVYVKFEN